MAGDGARAVIEAAMDARRLGHGPALREAFLEDAADAYLTDAQHNALDDDWFARALAYVTTRVHGANAPLTRMRPRRRHLDPSEGPTYHLADFVPGARASGVSWAAWARVAVSVAFGSRPGHRRGRTRAFV
ncbi:hypothetical protein ACWGR4_03630 [Embleya sp. NPDC055664]